MTAGAMAYRVAGGLLVWALSALTGANLVLLLTAPSAGLDNVWAVLQGLLAGAAVGVLAGVWFARRTPPEGAGRRWLVLAALATAVVLSMMVEERVD